MKKIAVIGAGIAGVSCARQCHEFGLDVTLFDKSRGVSGRSTTKRWVGIDGIDMGVPFFNNKNIPVLASSLLDDLTYKKHIFKWDFNQEEKNNITLINAFVGSPKMSSICRVLAEGISLIRQQRICRLTQDSDDLTYTIHSETDSFKGFDVVVFSIPAPQLVEIESIPDDIKEEARKVSFSAVNTLLIETSEPLWDKPVSIVKFDNSYIDEIIADYHKPKRKSNVFTYAVQSNRKWATETFDILSKEAVEDLMLTQLKDMFNQSVIVDKLLHRWRYAHVNEIDKIKQAFLESELKNNFFTCGDWCNSGGFMNALVSGLECAERIKDANDST